MRTLNVALIGTGFMGRTHSNAYNQAPKFFSLPVRPVMKVVSARNPSTLEAFAQNWGWQEHTTDWKEAINREDIDIVDICTPNNLHHEMVLEAARAGKTIICEKPLAMNGEEAEKMVQAVEEGKLANMVMYNYRRVPAVTLAKQMIDEGRLGRIFHYRAKYLQDWTIDPNLPQGGNTLWRLDAQVSGSGVLGDLLSHSIDLAVWLTGSIREVTAMTETFVKERKRQEDPNRTEPVRIDDACAFLARFENGALGTFESTRYARGRKNQNTFEINGEKGSIAFDLEESHLLYFYDHHGDGETRGFRKIQVWDSDHPYMSHWWVPGCSIGYEHTFIHAVADFFTALERGETPRPSFRDAYEVQRICDAVLDSAALGSWKSVS
jgi:predicted dehydrogenase